MTAYVIAQYTVNDQEKLNEYVPLAVGTILGSGGKVLVAADEAVVREGSQPAPRTVVIEFESRDAAQSWYDSADYQKVLPLRLESTDGCLFIVDGFEMPA